MLNEIRLVEIEIHSHCNRKCVWCPNLFLDRGHFTEMDEGTYIRIINDLKRHRFSGTISYSRYNEPMADPDLLKSRVSLAKEQIPNVKLVTNTNGDFLTKENLTGLAIDELTIMDYDCIDSSNALKKLINIGASIKKIRDKLIYAELKEIKILYYLNWPRHANVEDRGGSLKQYSQEKREKPCYEPIHFIGIDYNGNVMPCCHMRSDNPEHGEYILGNLKDNSIYEIYNSERAKKIREAAAKGKFNFLKPCRFCQKYKGRYTRENPGIDYE